MTESIQIDSGLIVNKIAAKLQLRPTYINKAIELMKEGGTVPFIARYRKEMTGSMDEEQLRIIKDDFESNMKMEERRLIVLHSIKSQDKFVELDPKKQQALENKIKTAKTLTEIEDLYLPYKPKRKTLATKALEKGLGPLAEIIREERTEGDRSEIIAPFITINKKKEVEKKEKDVYEDNIIKKELTGKALIEAQKKEKEEKKKKKAQEAFFVKDEKEALSGAMDIIAEDISHNAEFRKYVREVCFEKTFIVSKVAKKWAYLLKSKEQIQKEMEEKLAQEETIKKLQLEKEEKEKKLKEKKKKSKTTKAKKQEGSRSVSKIKEIIKQQQEEERKKAAERKKKLDAEILKRQKRELDGIVTDLKKTEADDEKSALVYEIYFEFTQEAKDIPPHRILAINRGEKEKVLTVELKNPDDELINYIKSKVITKPESLFLPEYAKAIEYAYRRYIIRAINREIRSEITKKSESHAITVFAKNLGALLMQPPLKGRPIIAIDPGFTHGSKVAVIDEKGQFKEEAILLKYERKNLSRQEYQKAERTIGKFMRDYKAYTIAIGNGTASRETEKFVAELAKQDERIEYAIVNEAGASVYSASKLAKEEFPTLGVEARGSISIARRLQDPLSELIKIDPKSIGVGMYQHDVNQIALKKELDATIEDCVNKVGVIVNSSSYKLLEYVSGLNKRLAKGIYDYRIKQGFKSREELKKVSGLGDKAFEQCAGFIKILDGANPLDRTNIHPESYWIVEKILKYIDEDSSILSDPSRKDELSTKIKSIKPKELVSFLGKDIGMPTLKDIVLGLLRPDRDPRDDLPQPILKSDIIHMEDLEPGMVLKGTVRNVVDFGAFVDIGLHDDGLVHISEMKRLDGNNGYISDPTEVIRVGDIIDVRIVEVDIKKHRIQLSMRLDAEEDPTSDRNKQSRQSSRVGEPSFGNITIRQKKKKN